MELPIWKRRGGISGISSNLKLVLPHKRELDSCGIGRNLVGISTPMNSIPDTVKRPMLRQCLPSGSGFYEGQWPF